MVEDIRCEMKLKDLETGMVVETANGTLLLVVKFPGYFAECTIDRAISNDCWVDLGHYNQDFSRYEWVKKYDPVNRDIIAVYMTKEHSYYKKTLSELLDKEVIFVTETRGKILEDEINNLKTKVIQIKKYYDNIHHDK